MDRHDPRHGPMDDAVRDVGNHIGRTIGEALPPQWGFALLLFPFDDMAGRMNYISNAKRETMLASLKELVAHMEDADRR